jgi:cytochrome c oxidase assembly protein subunit 15
MNSPSDRRSYLHIYAIALSICTYLLLFAGGMVTSTNSGLSVPDWPTTFGRNMFMFPPSMMKGGIFYEHGHRLFASLVGLLTVGNCIAMWIWEKRRWLKVAGSAALVLVIAQGVLGGLTVKFKLPMPVSAAHACTAELFFMLTVLMSFATSRAWMDASPAPSKWSRTEILAAVFCAAVFLQILVGAVMRHSYAGLSIPTFPLAYGEVIPPFWNFGIAVHFIHTRIGASLLLALGIPLAASALFSGRRPRAVRFLGGFLAFALLLQCALGMFTVWSGKAPVPTTFHLSGGALVFATGFLLFLAMRRLRNESDESRAPAVKAAPRASREAGVAGSVAVR